MRIFCFFLSSLILLSCSVTTESIAEETGSSEAQSSHKAESSPTLSSSSSGNYTPDSELASAFENQLSNIQVMVRGKVTRILSDDTVGDRHQRFILRLNSGQTLLIAHNIDLAPRIAPISVGNTVSVYGEYEWNEEGGVIHWTHADPDGNHIEGWIRVED